MRFVVSGGGTGGHIYPALAIARGLEKKYPGAALLYIGTARGMEAEIVHKENIPFEAIAASGLERKLSLRNLLVLGQAGLGFWQAARIIRQWRPDAVIGTGGYVCGPVVLAAIIHRVPTLLHEQNAFPGITNKMLSRFAGRVAVTFADSVKYFPVGNKVRLTGLPVRPEILAADRETALLKLGLKRNSFFLLSFGGSRGARAINEAMVDVIKNFADDPRLSIMHITGVSGYQEFMSNAAASGIIMDKIGNITIVPYVYNMPDILAAASLVIGRAGATSLAELTAIGIPAILIPYPYAAENHQEFNARALEKEGAALVILNRQLSGKVLCKMIIEFLDEQDKLSAMRAASKKMGRRHALKDIIECVDDLIKL